MTSLKQGQTTAPATKRSYSYQDLIKMQSQTIYSSMGKVIPSTKPSAPYATFGHSQRKQNQKKFDGQQLAKIDSAGKIGPGPAAYLPPRHKLQNGQIITGKHPANEINFQSAPSFSIGKNPRKGEQRPKYNYMNSKNDDLDINYADLKRRNSMTNVRIGTDARFHEERKDKITPGPTYNPTIKPQVPNAPKYTLGAKRIVKGQDPIVPPVSTTNLVGPSSYFQKGKKSQSMGILRTPINSNIKNQPAITFTKGPKSLATYKSSIDQTYDLKHNTMMAHYDFEYDAGKGLNSGLAYMKKNLMKSSMQPLQKNKMKSYSMVRATRESQAKRGKFISMMSQVPQNLKISIPKF